MEGEQKSQIIVGKFSGVHGVRGWLRVLSYTRPRENIFTYLLWQVRRAGQWCTLEQRAAKKNGNRLIVQLAGIDDRDAAYTLIGADIAVKREQLAQLEYGQHYWADLIGLTVINQQGEWIGRVDDVIETAVHDVLSIIGKKKRLIPYVQGRYITHIDLDEGKVVVNWSLTEDATY